MLFLKKKRKVKKKPSAFTTINFSSLELFLLPAAEMTPMSKNKAREKQKNPKGMMKTHCTRPETDISHHLIGICWKSDN